MKQKKSSITIINPTRIVILACITVLATVLLNLFIAYIVLPQNEGFLSVYVPAKSGGETFYVTASEFQTIGIVSTVIAGVLAGIAALFARQRLHGATALTMMLLFVGTILYFPVMLGNSFHSLFGGMWSLVGVAIALVIVLIIEVQFFKQVKMSSKTPTKTGKR